MIPQDERNREKGRSWRELGNKFFSSGDKLSETRAAEWIASCRDGREDRENGYSEEMVSVMHLVSEPASSIIPRAVGKSTAESI